jgi:polyphosphate kinase 2 (PPK2 family)
MTIKSVKKHSKASTRKATPKKSGLQAVKKANSEKTEKTKTQKGKGRFSGPSPPYKLKNAEYKELITPLQIELLKVQRWVKEEKEKVVIVCEGRDAAGKGGAIKRFTEHLNPRGSESGGSQ